MINSLINRICNTKSTNQDPDGLVHGHARLAEGMDDHAVPVEGDDGIAEGRAQAGVGADHAVDDAAWKWDSGGLNFRPGAFDLADTALISIQCFRLDVIHSLFLKCYYSCYNT